MAGAAFVASSPAPPVELAASEGVGWIDGPPASVRPELARPRASPVTPRLLDVVRSATGRGADALVFVARRGDALRLVCEDCGRRPSCESCGAGLVAAGVAGRLACRVCSAERTSPSRCESCGGPLAGRGWGHERVAGALERSGVGAPVVRVVRGAVPERRPRPAVVVGTLAAAHAVGEADAVCVADLDPLLARPDFRAGERALQTLHDLAAVVRPGGRFLVQTREPEHHAVQAFTRGSYRYFLEHELPFREETGYPPFGVVVRVELPPHGVEDLARLVRPAGGEVVGALPAPSGRGRSSALVRARSLGPLLDPLRAFAAAEPRARIDVDPVDVI
jgi:primosomal protein N' (replication factor Y)